MRFYRHALKFTGINEFIIPDSRITLILLVNVLNSYSHRHDLKSWGPLTFLPMITKLRIKLRQKCIPVQYGWLWLHATIIPNRSTHNRFTYLHLHSPRVERSVKSHMTSAPINFKQSPWHIILWRAFQFESKCFKIKIINEHGLLSSKELGKPYEIYTKELWGRKEVMYLIKCLQVVEEA